MLQPARHIAQVASTLSGAAKLTADSPAPENPVVERRFAVNGNVELVYRDGTVKQFTGGGYSIKHPNGLRSTASFESVQPPSLPGTPPNELHRAWSDDENTRLLDVMRSLVGGSDKAIQAYLLKEPASMTVYGRIRARTEAISQLVQQ